MATKKKIQPTEKTVISLKEWKKRGATLFGKDKKLWRFVCPVCGESQSYKEFIDIRVFEAENKFYYSCIGRWSNKRGCDWSLGGLLQIHKTEVQIKDGSLIPVMEFATKSDIEKKA